MAFSGGVFSLVAGNPVVTNTVISSTTMNNTLSDIATNGLSNCVLKDGSQTITANIPMSSFKFTGLAAGSSNGDSLRYEQVNGVVTTAGDILYATGAGTLARLAIGTASQILRVNSGATAPQWVSVPSAAQTFLTPSDVALNNAANYFDICNTGSIGASGQTWLIIGVLTAIDASAAGNAEVRIWDGSSVVYAESSFLIPNTSSTTGALVTILAVVTPSGATTYTLSAKSSSTSSVVKTTGASGTANKATSITAIRLI